MRDPRRLLELDATEAERALLYSAHGDGPSIGSAQRILIALEGSTAGSGDAPGSGHEWDASISTASMGAPATKLGALAKIGLAALLGAGAVGGGAIVHHLIRQQPSVETASAPVPKEAHATGPAKSPRTNENASLAAPLAPPSHAPGESETDLREPHPNAPDDSLSAELRLLDAAREAVDARNPTAAQRALDSYAQRFPQGRLTPEAAVLRLAVLVRRGDRAAATLLATQLLGNEDYKTYGPRIRSLLREAER